jgi:uncharacterized protein YaiL (DUF2058 family)
MQNLRDKLLQAGLVSADQAKKSETEKPRPRRDERRDRPERHEARPEPRQERAEPRIPKLPPLPGSREHQRLVSKKQTEIDRKLRELVHANDIAIDPGARTFHFVTRKGRLRRLELSEAQAKLLEEGKLAVVERPEPAQIEHSLVPPEIAAQMKAIHEKSVRFLNTPGDAVGFLSDAELEVKKREEAELPPEAASGEGDADREESA